jgi:hypothetical protein
MRQISEVISALQGKNEDLLKEINDRKEINILGDANITYQTIDELVFAILNFENKNDSNISQITLNGFNLNDERVPHLCPLFRFAKKINKFDLKNNQISDYGVSLIMGAIESRIGDTEAIDLTYNKADLTDFNEFCKSKGIKCTIGEQSQSQGSQGEYSSSHAESRGSEKIGYDEVIKKLRSEEELKTIDLSGEDFSNGGKFAQFLVILQANYKKSNVENLTLDNCQIHDGGATYLGNFLKEAKTKMKKVSLENNKIGSTGLVEICNGLIQPTEKGEITLTHFNLSNNGKPAEAEKYNQARRIIKNLCELYGIKSNTESPHVDQNPQQQRSSFPDPQDSNPEWTDSRHQSQQRPGYGGYGSSYGFEGGYGRSAKINTQRSSYTYTNGNLEGGLDNDIKIFLEKNIDIYAELGVASEASSQEIRKAYLNLTRQKHPDKVGGNHSEMQNLNNMKEILSDPGARQHYDAEFEKKFHRSPGTPSPPTGVIAHSATRMDGGMSGNQKMGPG